MADQPTQPINGNGHPHNGNGSGPLPNPAGRIPVANAEEAKMRRVEDLVGNVLMMREGIFRQLTDPRRSVEEECGYPLLNAPISPDLFRSLYDREAIAARVVQVLPKECWQVTPKIYEDENSENATPFEEAWDSLEIGLESGKSWHQDELGGTIWDRLLRADILSGIGHFGVLLLGIDDGRNLQDPVEGVVVFNKTVTVRNVLGQEWTGPYRSLKDSPPTDAEAKHLDAMVKAETVTLNRTTMGKEGWHTEGETHAASFLNDWRSAVGAPEKKRVDPFAPTANVDAGGFAPDLPPDEGFVLDVPTANESDAVENVVGPGDGPSSWDAFPSSQESSAGIGLRLELSDGEHFVVNRAGDVWELRDGDGETWNVETPPNRQCQATRTLTLADWQLVGDALLGDGLVVNDAWGETKPGEVGGYGHGGVRRPSAGPARDSQGRGVEQIAADQARKAQSWGKMGPNDAPQNAPAPKGSEGQFGTDAQYAWQGAMPPAAMSGTDQQYFGVYFGPSEAFPGPDKDEVPGSAAGGKNGQDGVGGKGSDPDAQTYADNAPRGKGGPNGKGQQGPTRKLTFLRPFDESLVQVVRYEWNIRNPRFGQPVMYRITLNDPREQHSGVGLPLATVFVHWSRVIHLADNLGSSEIFGVPRMRPVLNRVLDLRKLYGASAEGYWKSAFTGFSFETNPQLGGDVLVDRQHLLDMFENFQNSLQRALITTGMTVKTLAPTVVDPASQIDVQITAICIQLACPKRVFMGSERGELASSQDDSQWNDVKRARQLLYLTPKVIVPFIDRLIVVGVLPEPEGYSVEWPDLEALGDAAKAAIMLQRTQAWAAYVAGNLESTIPVPTYATQFDQMTEEEANEMVEAAKKVHDEQDTMTMPPQTSGMPQEHPEGTQAAADNEQQQQQAAQQAQQQGQQADQQHQQKMAAIQQKQGSPGQPPTKAAPKPGGDLEINSAGETLASLTVNSLLERRDVLRLRLTDLKTRVAVRNLFEWGDDVRIDAFDDGPTFVANELVLADPDLFIAEGF